jgi:hypothetical protein
LGGGEREGGRGRGQRKGRELVGWLGEKGGNRKGVSVASHGINGALFLLNFILF